MENRLLEKNPGPVFPMLPWELPLQLYTVELESARADLAVEDPPEGHALALLEANEMTLKPGRMMNEVNVDADSGGSERLRQCKPDE